MSTQEQKLLEDWGWVFRCSLRFFSVVIPHRTCFGCDALPTWAVLRSHHGATHSHSGCGLFEPSKQTPSFHFDHRGLLVSTTSANCGMFTIPPRRWNDHAGESGKEFTRLIAGERPRSSERSVIGRCGEGSVRSLLRGNPKFEAEFAKLCICRKHSWKISNSATRTGTFLRGAPNHIQSMANGG